MKLKNGMRRGLEREDVAQGNQEVLDGGREVDERLRRAETLHEDHRIEVFEGSCCVEVLAVNEVMVVTEATLLLCLVEGLLV